MGLSATNFFSEAFTWFANLSSKLPQIDFKTFFIVVVALLLGIGLITGLTFFGSYRFKLMRACKKIIKYLRGVESIDDDNFGDFTAQCFSAKAPSALRDCWVQYLGVRFGYPSDIVSEQNVYDKQVKRVREIRANVFIAIALILIAVFAFWGYGTLDGKDMGVIFLAGLLLSGIIYLLLVIFNRLLGKRCLDAFGTMQEDLDAKVNLQVEKSFATDSSPLSDLAAIIDEIVTRNTAKEIGFEMSDGITPIEELIAMAPDVSEEIDYINSTVESESAESEPKTESAAANETEEDKIAESAPVESEPETDDSEASGADTENSAESENDKPAADAEDTEDSGFEQEVFVEAEILQENTEDNAEIDTEPSEDAESEEDANEAEIVEDNIVEIKNIQDEVIEAEVMEAEVVETETVDTPSETEDDAPTEETGNEAETEEVGDGEEAFEEEQENTDETDEQELPAPSEESSEETAEDSDGETDIAEETTEDEVLAETDEVVETEEPDEAEETDTTETDTQAEEQANGENSDDDKSAEEDDAADEPEVRYVVEEHTEDDEIVKPAKLVKLPNLVDYMLSQNLSKKVKMNMATLLLSSYKKFENSKEDKEIIVGCMKKLLISLQSAY